MTSGPGLDQAARMVAVGLVWLWFGAAAPATSAGATDNQPAEIAAAFPGWEIDTKAEGDLNGDALADVVVTLKRTEGAAGDTQGEAERQAWLAVFFRTPAGKLRLHTKAARAVCLGCGGMKATPDDVVGVPSVDRKGILVLEYEGGSREMWNYHLKWRYDKSRDRFGLIGETYQLSDTLNESGEVERGTLGFQDINYLSGKMIRKVGGQGRRTCTVTPGIAAPDLAAFNFEKYTESEDKQVKGSCRK